jgi:hypothetical protein
MTILIWEMDLSSVFGTIGLHIGLPTVEFTSLRLPFSKYSAILAKSPPNKILAKFHLLRKFPQNSIHSGLGLDSELARNPAMCLVHN